MGHDHTHLHDHAHARDPSHAPAACGACHGDSDAAASDAHGHLRGAAFAPLLLAIALAIAAEAWSYLAPATLPLRIVGLGVAAIAIALAGRGVFATGVTALRHGRLNIDALMTGAVTGAFVIGQWPEAAMVMALYALSELIEARAVAESIAAEIGGTGAARRFNGHGFCYIETGDGMAAYGAGNFYAIPAPAVSLEPASQRFLEEEHAIERDAQALFL